MAATNVQRFSGDVLLSGEMNLRQVSNVASLKVNSNVVTEFPRSKKLIKYPRVVLTANGLNQGYTVSGSDDYNSGLTFYGAFTPPTTLSTPSGAWLTPTSGTNGYSTSTGEYGYSEQLHSASLTGEYVQIVLPEKINPVYFTVQPYPESANNNEGLLSCINEGEIWASNDSGTTWTPVGKIQNFTPTGLYQEHIVDNFNVPGYYDTFALIIHKNNGHPFAGVGEWKIFGTPEYDPDAHGTDVVVKSPPNVPNTDWLDVYYDGQDYTSTPATVTDNSGNNLTGTLNGGVGFDTGYKAFTFDGVDDYISNIQSGYTSSNTYTVGMWFNRTANIQGALFQYGINSSTPTAIGMFYYGSANHYITSYIAGGARADTDFNASYLSLNEWNHAASVYSPEGVTLYINGVMVAKNTLVSPTWNNSITIPTSPHLTIGAQGDTSTGVYPTTYFTGSIANFRLFKRALTSDELWQLYAYQKEYFGRGDLGMTLKAGRLGIGTSEPRAALDVRGDLRVDGHAQLETLAPRYYSSMQRGTFHNVSSHIITGFDHQAEGYATPVLGWEVHINFNHHHNTAIHVEIDGGYLSTAPGTHVALSEVATRKYDQFDSAFTFYTDTFYIGSDIAHTHAAVYTVIRITNSQVPGIPSAIHTGDGSTVRYHMLGHTMYVKPGIGSALDVAIGQITGNVNARLHGIRVATSADNITGAYTVYTYH